MPPRMRTRATKGLKENISEDNKRKVKSGKVSKAPRKALADKTNSLSDDNASIDVPVKTQKLTKNNILNESGIKTRPRRDRKIPTRYVENVVLNSLSNSKDASVEQTKQPIKSTKVSKKVSPTKQAVEKISTFGNGRPRRNCRLASKEKKNQSTSPKSSANPKTTNTISPFKTPSKTVDTSMVANRPKRICRLPSRLEDHSISPNKFIPVKPCHASTPIAEKSKTILKDKNTSTDKQNVNTIKNYFKNAEKAPIVKAKTNPKPVTGNKISNKKSPDNNNNAKSKTIQAKTVKATKLATKQVSPNANKKSPNKRLLNTSLSFKVFEDKQTNDNVDVYEFTFDPNEEPAPQKKKRKRTVNKKPPKPKMVVFKSNYNHNVSKAIEALKSKVKPGLSQNVQENINTPKPTSQQNKPETSKQTVEIQNNPETSKQTVNTPNPNTPVQPPINESAKNSIHESNYASIRIEDIAADFETPAENIDLNYSPVNSPCRPKTPEPITQIHNKDPLNLQEDSFFDDHPVASSSMNVSVRHPTASPWRVEFGSLPIKWNADTYVKPNMTPAVECSFINSEDTSKKKHVYTNIVPENNESLPQIENNSNLVQKSIISFIKEVAERQANKKRGRSVSPGRAHSLFEDLSNNQFGYQTPKKSKKSNVVVTPNVSENSNNKSNDTERTNNSENVSETEKNKDKDCTYFGFDESENQENVSPVKKVQKNRLRGLRSQSRAALQELNNQGPTRSVFPGSKKLASSEVVNKLYEQLKSAEDAPSFPEKETVTTQADNNETTTISDQMNEDSDSVHLFEDIELVHHLKAHRKSYGKTKKVTFQQSYSDSDEEDSDVVEQGKSSGEEDDLADLTFQMPEMEKKKTKKKKPKKQFTKKEEKEAEEWAASFNSMCDDVDEFRLIVE